MQQSLVNRLLWRCLKSKRKSPLSIEGLSDTTIDAAMALRKPQGFYDDFYNSLQTAHTLSDVDESIHTESEWLFRKAPKRGSKPLPSEALEKIPVERSPFIEACVKGDFHTAEALFKQLPPGEEIGVKRLNYLMSCYASNSNLAKVKETFLSIQEKYSLQPDTTSLCLLLKGYAYAGRVEVAEALLDRLRDALIPINQLVYQWLIEGHMTRKGTHAKVLDLYWEAKKHAPPSSKLCALVIGSCAREQEAERALLVYKEFLSTKGQLTAPILVNLLNACCQRKDHYKEALGILNQLETLGYVPNVKVYEALLTGCAKTGDLKTASILWHELCNSNLEVSRIVVTQMLYVIAGIETETTKTSIGNEVYDKSPESLVSEATKVYNFCLETKKSPNGHVLAAYLAVAVRNLDVELAEAIFWKEYQKYSQQHHPNAIQSMIQLYQRTKSFELAHKMYQYSKDQSIALTFHSYVLLIRGTAVQGDLSRSLDFLREMVSAGHAPFVRNVKVLYNAAFSAERMDIVLEMRKICAPLHPLRASAQTIFVKRGKMVCSLLDEVYGPERGITKDRTKRGMAKHDEKKLISPDLHRPILETVVGYQ